MKNFEHLNKSRWILSVPVDILDFLTTKVPEGILLVRASVVFLDFQNTKLAMKDDFTRKFFQQQKSPNGYCLMFLNYRNATRAMQDEFTGKFVEQKKSQTDIAFPLPM